MKRRTREEKIRASKKKKMISVDVAVKTPGMALVKTETMSFPYLKRDLTKTLALTMLAIGMEAALWFFLKK